MRGFERESCAIVAPVSQPRILSYDLAINEAFHQLMESDERVFVIGQGVKSPWYVGNTTRDLFKRFGPRRVIDTPVSENTMTGAAVGASIVGMRPIVIHPRMDFMVYAVDQIINEAANWHYMFGGRSKAPMVVRAIINRGGEQGAQHSQALQAWFAHIPGLKVVMPASPRDAKGLLIAAVRDDAPVVFIDDRWLYGLEEDVPEELFETEIGKALVRREGSDITIVALSYMVKVALEVAERLSMKGISVEVVDVRTLKPLDAVTIATSVKKTGKVVVAEAAWRSGGFAGEIVARIAEEAFDSLVCPPARLTLPDVPAPTSAPLEESYYSAISVEALMDKVELLCLEKKGKI